MYEHRRIVQDPMSGLFDLGDVCCQRKSFAPIECYSTGYCYNIIDLETGNISDEFNDDFDEVEKYFGKRLNIPLSWAINFFFRKTLPWNCYS